MNGPDMNSDSPDESWLAKMGQKVEHLRQVADDVRQSRTDFSHKLGTLAAGTIAIAASAAGVLITKSDICPWMRADGLFFSPFLQVAC